MSEWIGPERSWWQKIRHNLVSSPLNLNRIVLKTQTQADSYLKDGVHSFPNAVVISGNITLTAREGTLMSPYTLVRNGATLNLNLEQAVFFHPERCPDINIMRSGQLDWSDGKIDNKHTLLGGSNGN